MDRAYKITTAVIIIFLVAGYAGYTLFLKPDTLQVITSQDSLIAKEIQTQTATKRIWKKNVIGKEQVLAPAIHDSVYRGVSMKKHGKYLYIADFGDMSLKRFDLKGNYIDKFGKGKGRGPGELQLFTDYTATDEGYVYIVDSRKRELMKFDAKTTDYVSARSVKYHPYRMVASGNHIFIESQLVDHLFRKLNSDGEFISKFGTLIHDQVREVMSISGDIFPIKKTGGLIYVPERASYIFYFDKDGKRIKTVQTIDRIPFKKGVRSAKNNIRSVRPPSVPVDTYTICVFNDKLFLSQISFDKNTSLPKTFFDVYALQSGSYLYSVAMPVATNQIILSNDTLYVLTRNSEKVKAYAYHEPS